ncbi:MAG: acyl-CoA dehydrogenase family protein [Chloroflexota bacterium]
MTLDNDTSALLIREVRRFVDQEVIPAASELEHNDEYPHALIAQMADLGLFGATISPAWGGLGLPMTVYAQIVEELARGWMSLTGVVNTHLLVAYMLEQFASESMRSELLPDMVRGVRRAAICLTEAGAGSDLQSIETSAVREGDSYIINGGKLFITNGRHGKIFAVLCKTDKAAQPAHRGISIIMVEAGTPGFSVARDLKKLGYKGVETCELVFQDCRVPSSNLMGREGEGFKYIMSGLEVGRINVASRAVGVAQAALEASLTYAKQRTTFGKPIAEHQAIQLKLADMATSVQAARLLVKNAAEKKDRGERADLEAGMAKLFASETALTVATECMRIHGGYGYTQDLPVERYYRDAPLRISGEGTNEIQRLLIARQLLRD